MDVGSVAAIASAIGTISTAVAGTVVALKVLIPMKATGETVHQLVNQQHTDTMNYQAALTDALQSHDVAVPRDASLPEKAEDQVQ